MGRKKILDGTGSAQRGQESLELRPFCYYCDREFDTVKTLIQHQRTKHFNCSECGLKFDTVTGLRVHMLNAYKRTMKEVPNAIQGRENPDIVVHGMEGLPKSILEERTQKAVVERAERDKEKAERAAKLAAERGVPVPPPTAAVPPPTPAPAPVQMVVQPAPAPVPMPAPAPVPAPAPAPAVPAAGGGGAMPNLSPAVAKLLSGAGAKAGAESAPRTVPGRVDMPVPPALGKLHPLALQVLAAAGALNGAPAGMDAPLGVGMFFPGALGMGMLEPGPKRMRVA